MKTLAQRLRHVREELGLAQDAMAERLGMKFRTYQDHERGISAPKQTTLARLHGLGVDINWLVAGRGIAFTSKDRRALQRLRFAYERGSGHDIVEEAPFVGSQFAQLVREGKVPIMNSNAARLVVQSLSQAAGVSARWLEFGDEVSPEGYEEWRAQDEARVQDEIAAATIELPAQSREFLSREFALIPRYDVQAAAGAGMVIELEAQVEPVAFRRSWIADRLGIKPEELRLILASGDSMSPTIKDGDLLMIHIADQRITTDRIYAIDRGGELVVKRLQRKLDGSVVVISDNPRYQPEVLTGDEASALLRTVGRVVWAGGAL